MSRLTKRLGDQVILKEVGITDCGKICDKRKDFDNPCDECPIDDAFRKLAHYEDLEEQGRLIEVKHGRWKIIGMRPVGTHLTHYCSICGGHGDNEMNYCPNCGAKMDEVENE